MYPHCALGKIFVVFARVRRARPGTFSVFRALPRLENEPADVIPGGASFPNLTLPDSFVNNKSDGAARTFPSFSLESSRNPANRRFVIFYQQQQNPFYQFSADKEERTLRFSYKYKIIL